MLTKSLINIKEKHCIVEWLRNCFVLYERRSGNNGAIQVKLPTGVFLWQPLAGTKSQDPLAGATHPSLPHLRQGHQPTFHPISASAPSARLPVPHSSPHTPWAQSLVHLQGSLFRSFRFAPFMRSKHDSHISIQQTTPNALSGASSRDRPIGFWRDAPPFVHLNSILAFWRDTIDPEN